MKSKFYHPEKVIEQAGIASLLTSADAATQVLVRLDERLVRSSKLAEGMTARGLYFDACASAYLSGDLVLLEELVLFDAGANIQVPGPGLSEALRKVRRRRALLRQTAGDKLTAAMVFALAPEEQPKRAGGLAEVPPDASDEDPFAELFADLDRATDKAQRALARHSSGQGTTMSPVEQAHEKHDTCTDRTIAPRDRLQDWLVLQEELRAYPPVLAAALLWDAWEQLRPLRDDTDLCRLLIGRYLQQRLTPEHAPLLALGLRLSPQRLRAGDPPRLRLRTLLQAMDKAAQEVSRQLDILSLGFERMQLCSKDLSKNARLPELITLFLRYPLLSRSMAANLLDVTPRGVDGMFAQLGPALPRELTGRRRYRLWGLL